MSPISAVPPDLGLKPVALLLMSLTLAGCLSGGGGGGSSASPSNPPSTQEPSNPETPVEPEPSFTEQTFSTKQARITGVVNDEMLVFLGVPYAQPPVGDLRFAPPAALPVTPSDEMPAEPTAADAYGARCPQAPSPLNAGNSSAISEDCLFLNIFRPVALTADSLVEEALPVMIYLHGGGLVEGSGEEFYVPTHLVERGVLVVTLNHRLGALGFEAIEGLYDEQGIAAGSYGILDQQEAMRWVKANIGNFGGDADNVTIFGQSAGGHSVLTHVVSPSIEGEGLFSKVISQSGTYAPGHRPPAMAFDLGQAFVQRLGCQNDDAQELFTCLRAKDLTEILQAQGATGASGAEYVGTAYLPVSGTSVLPGGKEVVYPESVWDALRFGRINPIDGLMVGFNREEGQFTVALNEARGSGVTAENIRVKAQQFLQYDWRGLDTDAIVDRYLALPKYAGLGETEKYPLALAAIETDWAYACNFLALLSGSPPPQGFSTNKPDGTTLYGYWFTEQDAPQPFGDRSFPIGAAHATELRYLWGFESLDDESTPDVDESAQLDQSQLKLAERMLDYWTAFAKTGDPNSSDGTAELWPSYDSYTPSTPNNMIELRAPEPTQASVLEVSGYHQCQSLWGRAPVLPRP